MDGNVQIKTKLEIWEKRLSNLKSIFLIILYIALTLFIGINWTDVKNMKITKVNVGGVFELTPKEKIETIEKSRKASDSLTSEVSKNPQSDNPTSLADQKLAEAIEGGLSVTDANNASPSVFWIYLGGYDYQKALSKDDPWTSKSFDFGVNPPNEGDILKALTATYKRDGFPQSIGEGEHRIWKRGKIVGVVTRGGKVKVLSIFKIEGNENPMYPQKTLYWAQVQSSE